MLLAFAADHSLGDNWDMLIKSTFNPDDVHLVVMLDFDGVAHPDPYIKSKELEFLPDIERILGRYESAYIVISSDWKKVYPINKIESFFCTDMRARILGSTPVLTDVGAIRPPGLESFVREAECASWMREAGMPMTPWIAIDDRPTWFSPSFRESRLVQTQTSKGFDEAAAQRLETLIQQFCEPKAAYAPAAPGNS